MTAPPPHPTSGGADPRHDDGPDTVVARPIALRPWCFGTAAAVLAIMLTTSVILPSTSDGVTFNLGDQIGIGGVGVLLAVAAWLPTRPRLVADLDAIRVRGLIGDYRTVPWELVRAIELRPRWRWARLILPADETISLYAVQRLDGARAVAWVGALRHLHARVAGDR
jgi:hypothetical protein